jgi:hypothetical protein
MQSFQAEGRRTVWTSQPQGNHILYGCVFVLELFYSLRLQNGYIDNSDGSFRSAELV